MLRDIEKIPASDELMRELLRKMLRLLAWSFLCVGAIYFVWVVSRSGISRFPYASAALIVGSALALVLSYKTDKHRLLLDAMNVLVFIAFVYSTLHQSGIYSSSLWWLVIPVAFSIFSGSFILGSVLAVLFMAMSLAVYVAGPQSFGTVSLTSPSYPDEQMLLAVLLSSLTLFVFLGMSMFWVRRMQAHLATAREVASQALQAKSLFLARVSHEIRTPLNGMIGATELLRSDSTPESQRQQLMSIQEHSAKMLLALVNDILDFSKIEAGKLSTVAGPCHIQRLLFQATELFSVQAFDKGIELTCSRAQDVPGVVALDEHRMRQVIGNLVSNAIKFTTQGGVHLHLEVRQDAPDMKSPMVCLQVIDTGCGIPAHKLPDLFKPYAQVDTSVARVYGGTGLGLSICDELVRLMGGRIEVESEVGKGTTFSVHVPLVDAQDDDAEPVSMAQSATRALIAASTDGMRRHLQTLLDDVGVSSSFVKEVPDVGTVSRARANVVFVDAPLLSSSADAMRKLGELVAEGVRVALLAPLGSDVMIGAAAGTTLLYKPVRGGSVLDFLEGSSVQLHVSAVPSGQASGPAANAASRHPEEPWLRVLVADDNPVNQVVAQTMLTNVNCECELVHNGAAALDALKASEFDLVLMDLAMPNMDGLTATREIRAREKRDGLARLPVIAMTGNNDAADVAACLDAGMDRFLAKPFGIAQLRRVLEIVADESATNRAQQNRAG